MASLSLSRSLGVGRPSSSLSLSLSPSLPPLFFLPSRLFARARTRAPPLLRSRRALTRSPRRVGRGARRSTAVVPARGPGALPLPRPAPSARGLKRSRPPPRVCASASPDGEGGRGRAGRRGGPTHERPDRPRPSPRPARGPAGWGGGGGGVRGRRAWRNSYPRAPARRASCQSTRGVERRSRRRQGEPGREVEQRASGGRGTERSATPASRLRPNGVLCATPSPSLIWARGVLSGTPAFLSKPEKQRIQV